jgi:hypothetical protein
MRAHGKKTRQDGKERADPLVHPCLPVEQCFAMHPEVGRRGGARIDIATPPRWIGLEGTGSLRSMLKTCRATLTYT